MKERKDEEILLQKIKKDPTCFLKLYNQHYLSILNFIFRRTGSKELAEDITQETFFKALKNIKRFRYRGRPIKSWLFRIAINEMNSFFRKKSSKTLELKYDIKDEKPSQSQSIIEEEEVLERKTVFLKIQGLIKELPRKYADVIALFYFEKCSILEIANIKNVPENTVKTWLKRARKRLLKLYDEKY